MRFCIAGLIFAAACLSPAVPALAQGYNEARRLDAAIRPLDSVDDKVELRKRLGETAIRFSW